MEKKNEKETTILKKPSIILLFILLVLGLLIIIFGSGGSNKAKIEKEAKSAFGKELSEIQVQTLMNEGKETKEIGTVSIYYTMPNKTGNLEDDVDTFSNNTYNFLNTLKKKGYSCKGVKFHINKITPDEYGNDSFEDIGLVTFTQSDIAHINFDNIEPNNILDYATENYIDLHDSWFD